MDKNNLENKRGGPREGAGRRIGSGKFRELVFRRPFGLGCKSKNEMVRMRNEDCVQNASLKTLKDTVQEYVWLEN